MYVYCIDTLIKCGNYIRSYDVRTTNHYVLQVTVSRDSSSNDYSLDAGALVLADQGLYVCIKYIYISK